MSHDQTEADLELVLDCCAAVTSPIRLRWRSLYLRIEERELEAGG